MKPSSKRMASKPKAAPAKKQQNGKCGTSMGESKKSLSGGFSGKAGPLPTVATTGNIMDWVITLAGVAVVWLTSVRDGTAGFTKECFSVLECDENRRKKYKIVVWCLVVNLTSRMRPLSSL